MAQGDQDAQTDDSSDRPAYVDLMGVQLHACNREDVDSHPDSDDSMLGAVGGYALDPLAQQNSQLQASGRMNVGVRQEVKLNDNTSNIQAKRIISVSFAVRHGNGNQSIALRLDITTPLYILKRTLETHARIPPEFQKWSHGGQELWNMDTLEMSNIQEYSVIQIDRARCG